MVAVRNSSPGRPEPCEGNLVAAAGSCGGLMVKHPWPLLEISPSDFRRLATLNINTYLPTYLPACLPAYLPSYLPTYNPMLKKFVSLSKYDEFQGPGYMEFPFSCDPNDMRLDARVDEFQHMRPNVL